MTDCYGELLYELSYFISTAFFLFGTLFGGVLLITGTSLINNSYTSIIKNLLITKSDKPIISIIIIGNLTLFGIELGAIKFICN